jgi:hypothetical protein
MKSQLKALLPDGMAREAITSMFGKIKGGGGAIL